MAKKIIAYTDGSCLDNQNRIVNFGGAGSVLTYGDHKRELCLPIEDVPTSVNRAEMTAVIETLKVIDSKYKGEIEIVSDSNLVVKGWNEWRHNWMKKAAGDPNDANFWRTSKKQAVENPDLWNSILEQIGRLANAKVSFTKVKGHNGNGLNERADQLAVAAAEARKMEYYKQLGDAVNAIKTEEAKAS